MLSVSPNVVDQARGRRQTRTIHSDTSPPCDYDFLRAWEQCQSNHATKYINPIDGTWVKSLSKTHSELKAKYTEELSKTTDLHCANCGVQKARASHCAVCIGQIAYHTATTHTLSPERLALRSHSREKNRSLDVSSVSPRPTGMRRTSISPTFRQHVPPADSIKGTRKKSSLSRSAPLPRCKKTPPVSLYQLPTLHEDQTTHTLSVPSTVHNTRKTS